MIDDLKQLINDDAILNKIIDAYAFYGKMSATYLAHKFKYNPDMANRIMKVIFLHESCSKKTK
jgi:hypothetical protein